MERCNGLKLKGSKKTVGNGGGIKHDHAQMSSVGVLHFIGLLHRWGGKEGKKRGCLAIY